MGVAKDVYGTISGAYAAYGAATAGLTALGVLQKTKDPLELLHEQVAIIQQKLDEILQELERIRLMVAGGSEQVTRLAINESLSFSATARVNAFSYLENPSNDTKKQFEENRAVAQLCTNSFKDNDAYWRRIHLEELDYADEWSGALSPLVEEGIWVWDFMMPLPAYLSALANWCIVILASDEPFQRAYLFEGLEMRDHIDKLHDALVKILSSFKFIPAPKLEEMKYLVFAMDDSHYWTYAGQIVQGEAAYKRFIPEYEGRLGFPRKKKKQFMDSSGINNLLKTIPGGKWRRCGYRCGAVEKYSGLAYYQAYPTAEIAHGAQWLKLNCPFYGDSYYHRYAMGSDYQYVTHPDFITVTNPDAFASFYERFLFMHTLRSWQQARALSTALSLTKVYGCIADLCAMRNEEPPSLPPEWNRYVVPSLRELHGIVPASLSNPTKHPGIRYLAEAMELTGEISLRRIFTPDT